MKVKYLNFIEQWREEKRQLLPVLLNVMDSGQYVGIRGKEISRFEKRVSKECKKKYAVALNSGTDSLTFALHSVGLPSWSVDQTALQMRRGRKNSSHRGPALVACGSRRLLILEATRSLRSR